MTQISPAPPPADPRPVDSGCCCCCLPVLLLIAAACGAAVAWMMCNA